jgi:putative transposase
MRKPRIFFSGGLYHVIARGNQRQRVFWDDADYKKYLSLLAERIPRGAVTLYSYCLMPNHIHLLIEQRGYLPLSRTIQRLQTAYTKYFNKRYKKIGHLFQGRYKGILVDKDSYLLELVRYIHLNPLRAKLEERIGRYPWTSHSRYLGKEAKDNLRVDTDAVLSTFGIKKKKAIRQYVRFMKDGMDFGHQKELYDTSGWQILGEKEFEYKTLAKVGKSRQEMPFKLKMSVAEIWTKVKGRHHCKEEPEGRDWSRMMEETAYLSTEGSKKTQLEVAEYFGIDQAAISLAIKRLRERWDNDITAKNDFVRWARGMEKP